MAAHYGSPTLCPASTKRPGREERSGSEGHEADEDSRRDTTQPPQDDPSYQPHCYGGQQAAAHALPVNAILLHGDGQ